MKIRNVIIRTMVICAALSLGLVVGVFGLGPVIADISSNPNYKVNENGQKYGSDLYATSIEAGPDLILATGKDGTQGYVYSKDLYNDGGVKTPEQAIKYQNEYAGKSRIIPLYASDGKTVIGKFIIGPGKAQIKGAKSGN